MTDDQLHDAIFADATAKGLADVGNDAGCAARMAAILPPVLVPTFVNERSVFDAFTNPADAQAVMTGLETASQTDAIVKRVLVWMRPDIGGVDLSNAAVRAMLDQLQASGVLTAPAVATLKALAERPAVVTADDVSRAWSRYRPGGKVAS